MIKLTRESITRLLCGFSALTCAALCVASALSPRSGFRVEADSVVTQLTAEQTLALYGRQLHGTWYNQQDGLTRSLTFDYGLTMEMWRPNDYSDTPTYIKSASGIYSSVIKTNLSRQVFLVYYSHLLYENNNYPWNSSNTSTHANVNLQFSVDFPQIALWNQWFMWGGTQSGATAYHPEYSYALNSVNDSFYKVTASVNGSGSSATYSFALFPWYPAVSTDTITESKLMRAYLINDFIPDDGSEFSLSKQDLVLNDFHPVSLDGSSLLPFSGGDTLLFFVSCPQVSGSSIIPPLVTTASGPSGGIGTQATVNTFETIDLSNIESGIAGIIKQQQENNYYERVQIGQLNTVIEQLNSIYADMVNRGEVPVSLTPALTYPRIGSQIASDVDSLTTYTRAQLPSSDFGNGAQGVNAIASHFGLFEGVWLRIAIYAIGFTVFCWFLFYGRG